MASFAELKARFDYPSRAGKVDWHCHSTASDGLDSPTELVRLAKKAGLEEIALTDHDTLAGLPEAVRAGRRFGVGVVRGAEITTKEDIGGTAAIVHVLALGLPARPRLLLRWTALLRRDRERRMRTGISRLQVMGYDVTFEEVLRHSEKKVFGRPTLARALLSKKSNRQLFRRMFGLLREPTSTDMFDHLLGRGKPAYVDIGLDLSPTKAFRAIRADGGLPVLAHPLLCETTGAPLAMPFPMVRRYAKRGLGGVEAFYSYAGLGIRSGPSCASWLRLARELGLAATGGSDHHGTGKGSLPGHRIGLIPRP